VNSTTLQLHLRPSRQCLFLLLFVYSGPFIIVGTLPWPLWGIIIIECCLGYSLTRNIKRYAQLHDPLAIKKITYSKEKGWLLIDNANTIYLAKLLPNSTVFSWLIILNFQCVKKKKKKHVLVFSDSLPPSLFRQLKVRLRYLTF